MDDREQEPAQESAQEARNKGTTLEYDAEDENALEQPVATPDRGSLSHAKEKK